MVDPLYGIAWWFVAQAGMFVTAWYLFCPKGIDDPLTFAHNIIWMLFAPVLLYDVFGGWWALSGDLDSRWNGSNTQTDEFLHLYISANILGIIITGVSDHPLRKKIPTLLHHVFSIACYGNAVATDRMKYWAAFDGLCEITNIPLTILMFSKMKEGGVAAMVRNTLGGTGLTINGAMLWLSFLLFRVLLFPYWVLSLIMDIRAMDDASWAKVSGVELTMYPLTTIFLWALSMMWFEQINKGLMKVIRGEIKMETAAKAT